MDRAINSIFWAFSQMSDTATELPPEYTPAFVHDAAITWQDETSLQKLLRDQAVDQEE